MLLFGLVAWLGCSSGPPPTGPSAQVSTEAAEALCKVFEGARVPCSVRPPEADATVATLSVRDQQIGLNGIIEEEHAALGIHSLTMRVEVQVDGAPRPGLTTPAAVFGGEAKEALLARAFHEWAVVNGVALADALLADDTQPALQAVDRAAEGPLPAMGAHAVYRGWSLLQGTSQGELAHPQLLELIQPVLAELDPGWHSLTFRIDHEPGNTRWRCGLDGQPHEGLCEAARRYAWPIAGPHSRIQQTYVLAPRPPEEAPD